MKRARTLAELYSFLGFRAAANLTGVFGDPDLRVVHLLRKKRQAPVRAVDVHGVASTTGACRARAMWARAGFASNWNSSGHG